MQKNLILIGFMGSGKSTIGHALSKALGYPHLDTDELIVREAGLSIPEIFERHGEEHFRELETATLRGLRGKTHQIISTGGGIIGRPENRALLQELGYVVWLSARPEEILQRTSRNSNRPLLQTENPLETIHTLLSARLPHYEKTAHLKVETGGLDSSEISAGIIDSARYHFSHHDD